MTFPAKWLRLLMVVGGALGVIYHYGTIFGPDAGVALLVTAYLFKLLEMYTRRDAFLVVILSFFVLATEFLFSISLLTSVYVFSVLIVISAALIALNMTDKSIAVWRPLKSSLITILQTIPLLLVLFFLFPRMGPIWELKMQSNSSRTGLSDTISPGDIADLSQSSELAFRVEFEGELPEPRDLYWRALVFDRFDGRTWYSTNDAVFSPFDARQIESSGDALHYQVYLEPTGQNWLPTIAWSTISGIKTKKSSHLVNYSIETIDKAIRFSVQSYTNYVYQPEPLGQMELGRFLKLPPSGNTRAQEMAKALSSRARGDSELMAALINRHFFDEEFVYTLQPPTLGSNSIDEFLFSTRRGFCSHYAGAFVYLMRAAGVPARMVGGYQGGEIHPIGNYLLVHQYDAHAWAEYWVSGKGWLRVDPTAAIAPHRIESGSLRDTLTEVGLLDSPFSSRNVMNFAAIGKLRLMVDYLDYLWIKNVVSYGRDAQNKLLSQIMDKVTAAKVIILLSIGFGGVMVLLVAWILFLPGLRTKPSFADKQYASFLRKLERKGLYRVVGEGIDAFSRRAQEQFPEQKININKISNIYSEIKYSKSGESESQGNKSATKSDSIAALEQQLGQAVASLKI